MYLQPVTFNRYQTTKNINFNANPIQIEKIVNAGNITEQISKMKSATPEAKKIFAGLTAAAGALLAEFAIYTEKNEQAKNLTTSFLNQIGFKDFSEFHAGISDFFDTQRQEEKELALKQAFIKTFEESPKRAEYYKMTKENYPNLHQRYKQIILNALREPENDKNKALLNTLEMIFDVLTENNCMYTKGYLDTLESKYSDCIEEICINVDSTIASGHSPMYNLVLINNEKITKADIKKWATVKNLSCDEFMYMRDLDENILINLNNLKAKNNKFRIYSFSNLENNRYEANYAFKLEFDENVSLQERLKIVSDVHTAIYGPIFTKEEKDTSDLYAATDIQTEMLENIVKDKSLDAVFNLVMFLEPNALSKYNMTGNDIKFIDKNSQTYKEIKQICRNILINLDLENEKIKELVSVMNKDDIFKDILQTRHSRLRFISRFVLKNNLTGDLEKITKEKVNILEQELIDGTDKCNYFCYVHPKGYAPQFYLSRNSSLGRFVKITLNDSGSINTIYEDYNKEIKERMSVTETES